MPEENETPAALKDRPWFAANEVLALLVELAALALWAIWGYRTAGGGVAGVLLGIAVLTAAIALWGLFAAPRARFRPPLAGVLAVKAVVLGGSVWALCDLGHRGPAIAFGVAVLVNTALAETFRRR
ncbi:YrdB family protein [Streptomyces sp. NBC_00829]|uniref:YrdB family protein n=1 Tax=Streptomyces sp. NBC_00829 TaxID=2903679 RepID=UPI0038677E46|nr:YrdB family protein [Streptomyces sp. NBC_00829]